MTADRAPSTLEFKPQRPARQQTRIPDEIVFGQSEGMMGVREKVAKVASTDVPVLIRGESGTGKEVLAAIVHALSPWSAGPFVKVNCPAIPGTLLESELFGFEKGAFTGAYSQKQGLVEAAAGGTLFLDEIAELELDLQAKLLHLLQDGSFTRIGGNQENRVQVRIVCATNRILEEEIALGRFREDLYYRINVVGVELPPLRERRADIPLLTDYFLQRYAAEYGRPAPPLSKSAMNVLLGHNWPGNIRELENLAKRYVILGSEEVLTNELLGYVPGERRSSASGDISLKALTRQAIRDLERKIILDVLHANHWNRKETARLLKISYRALFYKIKQAGVPPKRSPSAASTGSKPVLKSKESQ